jgi:hypothetical protein
MRWEGEPTGGPGLLPGAPAGLPVTLSLLDSGKWDIWWPPSIGDSLPVRSMRSLWTV